MRTSTTRERTRSHSDRRIRVRRPSRRGEITARRTLESVLESTMNELVTAGRATCPVCSERELEPTGCGSCGSRLS